MNVLLHPLANSLCALIGYGSWAAYSNATFGRFVAMKAFCVQGSFAFLATMTLTALAAWLYHSWGRSWQAITCSFIACFSIMATIPTTLHLLIKTPNILLSILPGLICGSLYILGYLFVLHKQLKSYKEAPHNVG